ncbi:MAG: DNA polymerase I [Micavibrio sp.]|nr:DNA polymerase I [Micavibrio sp.]
MSEEQQKTLYLVDGSAFIFRAYHALPPMTRADGTPVNAVLGFVNMLVKLLADMQAKNMAVIFDAARANFRNDIYPEYKANRSETPEDLVPQFPLIREATEAFDLPCLEMEGFEADDLIATYAKLAVKDGWKVVIVSSDKDLMQLVNDNVSMFDPMKNKYMNRAEVIEKFGVPPEGVVDVQALAGDSTDNVPGVPGIGIKTAALLIEEYGNLETLLERAGEIKQNKRRESLIEFAEQARISKRLVMLDENVDVPVAVEDLKAHDLDNETLLTFLQAQGFKSVLTRLGTGSTKVSAQAGEAQQAQPVQSDNDFPEIKNNKYCLINKMSDLSQWLEKAQQKGHMAFDTETTGLTPAKADLVGISLCIEPGEAAYIPIGHGGKVDLLGGGETIPQLKKADVMAVLKPVLEDSAVLKIGHNIKFDLQLFMKDGIYPVALDDTMLISYVLDGSSKKHNMDALSEELLGHVPISFKEVAGTGKAQKTFDEVPIEDALNYAAEDADITLRLWHALKPRLAQEQMVSVYEQIERPLISVIAQMELDGIKVDPTVLHRLSHDFAVEMARLETEIHAIAGTNFNIASPKQIGEILFDQMNLSGGKKTKTGQYATDASALEKLAEEGNEIVQKILDWRQMAKLRSTYTESLQEQINPKTGRVHTSYSMAGTSTGRLASSDPNLQNIPIRTEEGRKIREAFVADEGNILVSIDYSQVELRLAAAMANIKGLKEAFKAGTDIHALTASQVFDVPLDKMTSEIRRNAKAINFGIIYGISSYGLAKNLAIPVEEAASYIKAYFSRFPELAEYMEEKKQEARQYGYVKTLLGRKCYVNGIHDKNGQIRSFAERAAINAPLQGTAADIIKKAMIRMPQALKEADLKSRMLLQVHDELIFEVPESEIESCIALAKDIMEHVVNLDVPLLVEAGQGKNWNDAH